LIDLFANWRHPVVLCTRTGLGTINHTLLSLEALRNRSIPILGIIFIGEDNPDTVRTISEMGEVKVLGRMPILDTVDTASLTRIFKNNFNAQDFKGFGDVT